MNDSTITPKLWTRDFIVISAVHFFISLIFYILLVTIAAYALTVFSVSIGQAGLIIGVFIIGALVGRLLIGRTIYSTGIKRTLVIGLLFFTVANLLYLLHFGMTFLLLSRFFHGIAIGVVSTAAGAIVAQILPDKRKGEGISYYSMSKTLAAAVGPFIGLLLSQHVSYQVIFIVCFALGVVCLTTTIFLHPAELKLTINKAEREAVKITDFIEPRVLSISIITLAISFSYASVLSFIDIYTTEIKLQRAAPYFFLVYAVTVLISRPLTGLLMDRQGANIVMYPAFVLFSAGMFLLSMANSSTSLLVASILIGLGFGNMQSCTQAIAITLTPSHRLAHATSTYFIFVEIGLGFGPYVIGGIISLFGFQNLYMMIAIFVLVTTALYYFLHGRKQMI